jgi:hypothetical protein
MFSVDLRRADPAAPNAFSRFSAHASITAALAAAGNATYE